MGICPLVFLGLFRFNLKFLVVALLYLVRPMHQGFQMFVGWRLIEVGQHRQHIEQLVVRVDSVGLCRFHQRVHNRTGLCALDGVAEQPVLAAHHEGADRILFQVVGDGHIAILQESGQLPFLVLGIPYRIHQLTALFWNQSGKSAEILIQNGVNDVLTVFSAVGICVLSRKIPASFATCAFPSRICSISSVDAGSLVHSGYKVENHSPLHSNIAKAPSVKPSLISPCSIIFLRALCE